MQGLPGMVPTELKIRYINELLQVGFHTVDFGSFVSPRAVPQMADTAEVLDNLNLEESQSELLAIIGNTRGARDALVHKEIDFLGFPFSVSETFQKRNLNSTIQDSFLRACEIQNLCQKANRNLVLYISMGFGNPYGEDWNVEIVSEWVDKLAKEGIRIMALSDTIGIANPDSIEYLFSHLIPAFPEVEFGAHFHTTPDTWLEKLEAAYHNGCRRFDGAIMGFGGCPMAKDDLTGNMATENILQYFLKEKEELNLNQEALRNSFRLAREIFGGPVPTNPLTSAEK